MVAVHKQIQSPQPPLVSEPDLQKLEMMVWYGAGWKYTLQKLGIVSIAELCKAGRDFSAEPDTRTNVLSFPLGVYIFL